MDESKGPSCRFRVSTLVACSRLATRYNGNHGIAQAAHHRSGSLVQSHNADTIVPLAYQAQQFDRLCSTSCKCRRFVDYVSPWKRSSQAECSSRMTLLAYVLHDRQQVGRGLSWILGNVSNVSFGPSRRFACAPKRVAFGPVRTLNGRRDRPAWSRMTPERTSWDGAKPGI